MITKAAIINPMGIQINILVSTKESVLEFRPIFDKLANPWVKAAYKPALAPPILMYCSISFSSYFSFIVERISIAVMERHIAPPTNPVKEM